MKKWTKAERERASMEGKARWAARKLRDTRQFQIGNAGAAGGLAAANQQQNARRPKAEILAERLGTERGRRLDTARQLINIANSLLNMP